MKIANVEMQLRTVNCRSSVRNMKNDVIILSANYKQKYKIILIIYNSIFRK